MWIFNQVKRWLPADFGPFLSLSLAVHIGIIGVAFIGWPYFSNPSDMNTAPVVVDVVSVGDITQVPEIRAGQRPAKSAQMPEKSPETTPSPTTDPTPAATPKSTPKSAQLTAPPPPTPKSVKSKPRPPTPAPSVPDLTKSEDKADDTPPPEENKKAGTPPPRDFSSVLTNLADTGQVDQSSPPANDGPSEVEKAAQKTANDLIAGLAMSAPTLGDKMTISQVDRLRQQLSQCWNVPVGAKDADELVVDLRVEMNPDRTVRSVEILNKRRYRQDSFFRAAADSARRALYNPNCTPLALPPDKYDQWKELTIRFNPKDMFG